MIQSFHENYDLFALRKINILNAISIWILMPRFALKTIFIKYVHIYFAKLGCTNLKDGRPTLPWHHH